MRGWIITALAVSAALFRGTASAAYQDNVTLKFDRGLSNLLGCWLEPPYQIYAAAKEGGVVAGATLGLGKGILLLPCRVVSGALDIVTFPVPCPGKGWDGLMEPQYNPWVEQPDPAGPGAVAAEGRAILEEPRPQGTELPGRAP